MLQWLLEVTPRFMIPILVAVVLAWLRKRLPPPSPLQDDEALPELEVLSKRFRRTQWWTTALLLGNTLMIGCGSWLVLRWANLQFAQFEGPAEFRLYPSAAFFAFFPGFGALTIAWPLLATLLKCFLGRETAELYIYWTNKKSGFDAFRAFWWGALLLGLPLGVLTLPAVPVHTLSMQRKCERAGTPLSTPRSTDILTFAG
jgi:hypothetical protein